MRIVFNHIIPFKGFKAINIFGVVFVRHDAELSKYTLLHERIHTEQMRELGYIGFYILYLLEWIYRLIFHTHTAYRGISFEREAYRYQADDNYLTMRKSFAQWRNKR